MGYITPMFSPAATDALAIVVLVAVCLAPLVWCVALYLRKPFGPFQFVLWILSVLLVRLLWRARFEGRLPLEPGTGAVVVCNHRSPIDPFFLQAYAPMKIHWMVAREYCQSGPVGKLLHVCEVIPVGRAGIDTKATKIALRYVERGEPVGILPEGRLNVSDQLMMPGRPGAAYVALKARVNVYPCYIEGSPRGKTILSSFFMSARARVAFGPEIDISPYYGRQDERGVLEQLTRRFMREIARLAGDDHFQPRLAGRRWKPGEEQDDP